MSRFAELGVEDKLLTRFMKHLSVYDVIGV